MYVDENTEYYKDSEGYYKLEGEKKYYLKSIDGNEHLNDNIKYSIGDKGNLIYKTFVMRENNVTKGDDPISNNINVEIVFYNTEDGEKSKEITFNAIGNDEYKATPIFKYEENDDISIVTMKAMRIDSDEKAVNFVQSAIDSKKGLLQKATSRLYGKRWIQ